MRDAQDDADLRAALFRVLLSLYPREYRKRYGAELTDWMGERPTPQRWADLLNAALVIPGVWLDRWKTQRNDTPNESERKPTGLLSMSLQKLKSDVSVAVRGLMKRPMFTAVAVLTLGLGFGAGGAIFSVVHSVLISPLHYPAADRLVSFTLQATSIERPETLLSPAGYRLFRDEGRAFERLGAYRSFTFNLTGEGDPEELPFLVVSANLFDVLQTPPVLGRTFNREDEIERAFDVVMIGHGLWTRKFGRDPGVLGKSILLGGRAREVVGVMPEGFSFPTPDIEAWIPIGLNPATIDSRGHWLYGVGRLAEDMTIETARAEARGVVDVLRETYAEVYQAGQFGTATDLDARIVPLKDVFVGDARRALWLVFGSVGLLLVIACANVGNLFLVRADSRERELALRRAIGAGERDILRLFMTEGLTLAVMGGALGLLFASMGVPALVSLAPDALPRAHEIRVGLSTAVFSGGLALLTAVMLGALPAIRFGKKSLGSSLTDRSATIGKHRQRVRQSLLGAQVALALVLLVGSGLLLQTFRSLRQVELGFQPERVLSMRISLPPFQYTTPEARVGFWTRLLQELGTVPGVQQAAIVNHLPLSGSRATAPVYLDDRPNTPDEFSRPALVGIASAGYFETLGISIVDGEPFTRTDPDNPRHEAIVSRPLAARLWPGRSAIGRRMKFNEQAPWFTVVGVTDDVRVEAVQQPGSEIVYYAATTAGIPSFMQVTTRTEGDPLRYLSAIQDAVWRVDPDLPVVAPRTMDEIVAASMARASFSMVILVAAGLTALFLGAVGIYGVVSQWVSERRSEIGIRIAIGAEPRSVMKTVVGQGMFTVASGLVAGVLGSLVVTRLMTALLFDVRPGDPITLGLAAVVLTVTALVAMYIPARRAASTDPTVVLRAE